ncbi:MAG TPA: glycosyltransferase, partial [Chloroflexota bacterium]|nr:glycosyltransferase [Chloroflexota bacterium]
MGSPRVLVVACAYPTPAHPFYGTYVHDQVQSLRRIGVDVDVLFIDGKSSRWNYLWGIVRLWRRLLTGRYDLIHAHYVLAGIVARAQWGWRVVLTHHGPEVLGYPRWQSLLCKLVTPLFDE